MDTRSTHERRSTKAYWIPCQIKRGGFTNERVFQIETDGGKLVGTANVQYLRDSGRRALDDYTPGYNQSVDGFVQCRKVREEHGMVLFEVPSSDLLNVPGDALPLLEG